MVSACVLIRTEHGRFEEVVKSVSQVKGVKRVFPVLGRYDVVADVEVENMRDLASTVLKISRLSGVVFTETLVEVEY
ncbi:MAG: Lrp/AsnC ligand binding domain-containing protein [Candidatus Bathyarchaeia archaeon]|nr:Lrp/AsnC family transcriptional regulator [Candidatus Bathyarchaeota archaeon]